MAAAASSGRFAAMVTVAMNFCASPDSSLERSCAELFSSAACMRRRWRRRTRLVAASAASDAANSATKNRQATSAMRRVVNISVFILRVEGRAGVGEQAIKILFGPTSDLTITLRARCIGQQRPTGKANHDVHCLFALHGAQPVMRTKTQCAKTTWIVETIIKCRDHTLLVRTL